MPEAYYYYSGEPLQKKLASLWGKELYEGGHRRNRNAGMMKNRKLGRPAGVSAGDEAYNKADLQIKWNVVGKRYSVAAYRGTLGRKHSPNTASFLISFALKKAESLWDDLLKKDMMRGYLSWEGETGSLTWHMCLNCKNDICTEEITREDLDCAMLIIKPCLFFKCFEEVLEHLYKWAESRGSSLKHSDDVALKIVTKLNRQGSSSFKKQILRRNSKMHRLSGSKSGLHMCHLKRRKMLSER